MKYLLDTNTCIHFLNGTSPLIKEKILSNISENINLCSIVKAELYFGAYKSKYIESNLKKIDKFFEMFFSHSFDDQASSVYGKIRSSLESKGTPIGPNDLMIASIALSNNLILVTNNINEFNRIDKLYIEDWTK